MGHDVVMARSDTALATREKEEVFLIGDQFGNIQLFPLTTTNVAGMDGKTLITRTRDMVFHSSVVPI